MPLDIPLRKALASGVKAAGAWLTLPSTAVARTLASTPGISWVLIDAEHGLINDGHYYDLANTIASAGASPIIRVPAEEPWMIKRALDAGVHGVMVPMANSLEIVRTVVKACKYPPQGFRGFGPMFTHAAGALGATYKAAANDDVLVIVQVEHPDSLANIDAIMAEGIDIALIGPYDLAIAMGVEHGSQEHEAAMQSVLDAANKAGKTAAMFTLTGERAQKRFEQGFPMVSITTDIDTLTAAFASTVKTALASGGSQLPSNTAPQSGYST